MRKMVVVRDKRKSDKYSMANREMDNGGRKKRDMTDERKTRHGERGTDAVQNGRGFVKSRTCFRWTNKC